MTKPFFSLIGLVTMACTPDPVLPDDSGESATGDSGARDTADEQPDYFEPVLWQVQEVIYLWKDGAFIDFKLEPGGSPVPSSMTIRFMTQAYLETGAEGTYCDWTTPLVLREENTRNDPAVWMGMQLEPSTLETDCSNMDPDVWEGGDPIVHMETASLWFGVGPSQAFAAVLETLYEDAGMDWVIDGEPYIFSLFFGLWQTDNFGIIPSEVNYAVAYQVDADNAIMSDSDGNAQQVSVGESLPEGVIRALPYHSQSMDTLPP